MQRERIKTLEEILRESPEARAYIAEVSASAAAKRALEPEPEPACPTCDGLGVVRADLPLGHALFGKLFPCPNPGCPTVTKRRAERYVRLCTLAQIPKEYAWLTFAEWEALGTAAGALDGKRDALGAALAFVAAQGRDFLFTLDDAARALHLELPREASREKCSLVFCGRNGVGKTSLAICIARALIEAGVQVVYMRLEEFFGGLKDRFREKPDYKFMPTAADEAELMALIQQVPVLIIDEFYADVTDWRKERAEALVNYRYTHQLPTIVTTNLDADTLAELWGLTTGHRLQSMAHWIAIEGIELRPRELTVRSR